MDSLTHNVRRANWLNIINQCQERPVNNPVSMSPLSGDRKPQIRF